MVKTKIIGTATAIVLAGAVGFGPGAVSASAAPHTKGAVAAAQPAPSVIPVTGTVEGAGAFVGQLSDLTASVVDGVVMLSGTIGSTPGSAVAVAPTDFTAPIQDITTNAGCSILNLDLGPLNLDLLGLVVDLSAISLDVTAVPGAGNLLGNLLCAVAGLLDGTGGALGGIAALLNRLLTGLGL